MKKIVSVILSFVLLITLLLPLQTLANEEISFDEYGIRTEVNKANLSGLDEGNQRTLINSEWESFPAHSNVKLDKEWYINFSSIATHDKIDAIVIERNAKYIPVTITLDNSKVVKIKAVENFLSDTKYTLKILLANGKKYKMDFTTIKSFDAMDNNSIDKAAKIIIGEPVQEYHDNEKEDYYFIEVLESGTLSIDVSRYDDYNINLNLSILDDVNKEKVLYSKEASQIGYGSGNSSSSRNITVDVEPGEYYLRIDAGYLEYNVYKGYSGEYKLTVNHEVSGVLGDTERNDTMSQALTLDLNSTQTGHILYMRNDGIQDEKDFYKIKVLESGRLSIDVSRYDVYNINLNLSILDDVNKEKVLYSKEASQSGYGSGNSSSSRNIMVDVEPGEYYLRIDAGYLEYNVYKGHSGEYKLTVNHEVSGVLEDTERNDTMSQALTLDLNSTQTGHILYMRNDGIQDEKDFYKIKVLESGRLSIDISRYDDYNINLNLSILDDVNKEKVLYSKEASQSGYGSGNSSSSRNIAVDMEPGEYYLRIDAGYLEYNVYKGYSGEYKLTVNFD